MEHQMNKTERRDAPMVAVAVAVVVMVVAGIAGASTPITATYQPGEDAYLMGITGGQTYEWTATADRLIARIDLYGQCGQVTLWRQPDSRDHLQEVTGKWAVPDGCGDSHHLAIHPTDAVVTVTLDVPTPEAPEKDGFGPPEPGENPGTFYATPDVANRVVIKGRAKVREVVTRDLSALTGRHRIRNFAAVEWRLVGDDGECHPWADAARRIVNLDECRGATVEVRPAAPWKMWVTPIG